MTHSCTRFAVAATLAVAAALAVALGGCAATSTSTAPAPAAGPAPASPMPDPRPAPPPGPATTVGTTASGGSIVSHVAAPALIDSGPTADAAAVLATLPEPLPPEKRVAAPAAAATGAAASSRVVEGGDADVPVPAPTPVLGEAPVLRDSVTMPVEAIDHGHATPGAAAAGGAAVVGAAGVAKGDTCWRVQVAAPPERPRAESMRDAAESQLLTKMVIETDRGLHKVRTRDCFTAAGADSLRRRADRSGFSGSFRFKATK